MSPDTRASYSLLRSRACQRLSLLPDLPWYFPPVQANSQLSYKKQKRSRCRITVCHCIAQVKQIKTQQHLLTAGSQEFRTKTKPRRHAVFRNRVQLRLYSVTEPIPQISREAQAACSQLTSQRQIEMLPKVSPCGWFVSPLIQASAACSSLAAAFQLQLEGMSQLTWRLHKEIGKQAAFNQTNPASISNTQFFYFFFKEETEKVI